MPFEPGHKKIGGRPKGGKNLKKVILREVIETALLGKSIPEYIMEKINTDPRLKSDPRLEIDILMDLMPYCYPKVQAVEITLGEESGTTEKLKQYLEDDEKLRAITKEMTG